MDPMQILAGAAAEQRRQEEAVKMERATEQLRATISNSERAAGTIYRYAHEIEGDPPEDHIAEIIRREIPGVDEIDELKEEIQRLKSENANLRDVISHAKSGS